MTSKRNASPKTLHNLLHEHHTGAKGWAILIFIRVSLNNIQIFFFQNWDGPIILKDTPCIHDINVFAMKFRKTLCKLVYKPDINNKFEKKTKWKASRRNNDNGVATFAMLKYGRNEK